MVIGRDKHIDDSASDSELAAAGDQVCALIAIGRQAVDHCLKAWAVASCGDYRLKLPQATHDGLQQRSHTSDEHLDRSGRRIGSAGVGQAAQHV